MVLLCGVPGDPPLEFIADALEESNHPFMIFSPRRMEELSIYFEMTATGTEGEIACGGKSALLSEITGIYNRMIDFSVTPEYKCMRETDEQYRLFRSRYEALNNWLSIAGCRVLNFNEPMKSNCSKLYQMLLIKKAGFLVPESLITNDANSVLSFQQKHGRLIYKSASGVRSIVAEFAWDDKTALIQNCPVLFQQCLTGSNYRVHVVGDQLFSTKINSTALDYRYAAKDNKVTELEEVCVPEEVQQKCIALSRFLQLPLAGIDLMQSGDNWYCFEVNPSPGFSYYENATGQPIAAAIAQYLSLSN